MKKNLNIFLQNMNTEVFVIMAIMLLCLVVFITSVKTENFENHDQYREGEDIRKYRMYLHNKHKGDLDWTSYLVKNLFKISQKTLDCFT